MWSRVSYYPVNHADSSLSTVVTTLFSCCDQDFVYPVVQFDFFLCFKCYGTLNILRKVSYCRCMASNVFTAISLQPLASLSLLTTILDNNLWWISWKFLFNFPISPTTFSFCNTELKSIWWFTFCQQFCIILEDGAVIQAWSLDKLVVL